MNHYKHFTIEEREYLLILVKEGKNNRQIAQCLQKSPSSISRELRRNALTRESYSAINAQRCYEQRRTRSRRTTILSNPRNVDKVTELLSLFWSPEQISNRLKREKNTVQISTSTIYRAIDQGILASYKPMLRLKSRQKKGGRGKSKCGHLNIEYSIHDRPKSVEKRNRIGHWESDTVRGAKWSGCIATHVERKSLYVLLEKMPDRSAKEMTIATIAAFKRVPANKCKSLTCDHGKEFSMHKELSQALGCKVYFADPRAPWQRGTNENTNGQLRQFYPKRMSLAEVTQEDLDKVARLLNRRPRKALNWKTPEEVFFHKSLHLT